MLLIAHRGNTSGSDPSSENNPLYIKEALELGFDCEIDVWYLGGEWWLGHDNPVYDVSRYFLQNDKLWCHAKNLAALEKMSNNEKIHCFWHQGDDFTLTSKNYIWTHQTNREVCSSSIIVVNEPKIPDFSEGVAGICTDYPSNLSSTIF
tara:strand:+ start:2728 stop:3174 length:447 start_codon:yes stop_codon:yes gene_type:complete